MRKTAWLSWVLGVTLALTWSRSGGAEVTAGDTITADNIAQAGELLTPSTRWMVERGMPISVIETKRVDWPEAYLAATEKYAGQVKLAPDGGEIFNYVAGCPFPTIDTNDPLAGFRVMWNTQQSPYFIDNSGTNIVGELISSKGTVQRTYTFPWRRLMWTGRLYTDPKPIIPHNPPLRHTNLWGPLFGPNDLKGLMILFLRYIPRHMPDDTYVYNPFLRKVRRIGFADRSDALGGSDFDLDSLYGFNANLNHWTFRVLAKKDILGIVHSGKYGDSSVWCAPRDGQHGILAALPCVSWEKRPVWIVEATPTDYPRDYAYSKRILFVDRNFYWPLVHEMYDKKGELWKSFLASTFYTKKPYAGYPTRPLAGAHYEYEEEQPFFPNWVLVDLQLTRATTGDAPTVASAPADWQAEWYFNENVASNTPKVYSVNYLIRSAR